MDKYLMMLYVTLDQERALKQFFIEHGWLFSKPDLCVTTDKLGPLLTLSTTNTEDFDQSITTSEHSINVPVSETEGTKSNKKRKKPTRLSRSPSSKQSKSEQLSCNVGDLTKTHHGTILPQTRSSNTSQSSAISNLLAKIHSQGENVKNVESVKNVDTGSSSGVLEHEPNDTNVDFPLTLQCSNQEQVVVKLENVEDIEDDGLEQPVHQMNQPENSEIENVDECSEIENVDNNEDNDLEDSNDFSDNTMEHHDDTMNEVLGLGAALDTDSKSTMLKPYTSSKQKMAFLCKHCGKSLRTQTTLRQHERRHEGDGKYKCEECEVIFFTKGIFESHKRRHQNNRSFVCSVCNRTFKTESDLKFHQARESGNLNFKCVHCGHSFEKKRELDDHMSSHTGDFHHLCHTCGLSFRYRSNLYRHKNSAHGNDVFSCNHCQKTFNNKPALRNHIKYVHTDSSVSCQFCSKSYISEKSLKRHVTQKHKNM